MRLRQTQPKIKIDVAGIADYLWLRMDEQKVIDAQKKGMESPCQLGDGPGPNPNPTLAQEF